MKKLIASMSVALTIMSVGAQTVTTTSEPAKTNPNVWTVEKGQCMATAVEKRDGAISGVVDTFTTSIKNAIATRKDSLKSAWAISDKDARKTAMNDARKTFKTSTNSIHEKVRLDRKLAWKNFETDAAACGVKNHEDKMEIVNVPIAY